jgi:anti-anti-sigma regulatory factor
VFDSLFNKKAAQSAAAAQPKGPIQPQKAVVGGSISTAGPLALSKESAIGADFQSVVDEAAIVFAGGEEKAAADMLIAFLKQTNGQANRRVWFMLLDLYQALDEKVQYEKLSLMFASRFGTSPPSWEEAIGDSVEKSRMSQKNAASAGRNVLIVDGPATDQIAPKAKDFIAASREMKSCKLDISRMKMDQSTIEGIAALQSIMAQLRKYKVAATLMGENHVAAWLQKKLDASKVSPNANDSPYWMLSLEILQWRGMMDSFEEQSLDYTITYEISGPGWEPSGVMTIESAKEEELAPASVGGDMIEPDEVISDVSIQRLQELINASLVEKGEARLDFRRVRRMEFSSAGTFLNILSLLGDKGKKVVIVNPSELILALGDVVGFGQCVTLEERKR